jgi:putative transposase
MLFAFLYSWLRVLLDLTDLRLRVGDSEAELLLLRHQLRVVRRQVRRPRFEPADRAIMAALSRLVSRAALSSMLVQPETVLGWHRELVVRIHGELLKVGHRVSITAIRNLLRKRRVPGSPTRTGMSWKTFLKAQASAIVVTDFIEVDTVFLATPLGVVLYHPQDQSDDLVVETGFARPVGGLPNAAHFRRRSAYIWNWPQGG